MSLGVIALATLATVVRVLILIFVAVVSGWGLAYLSIISRKFENIFIPVINVLESVPVLAFLPIVLVLCVSGIGGALGVEVAVSILVFTAVVWNIWIGIYQSFKTVPLSLLEVCENYRIGFFRMMKELYIPHSMPSITSNLFSSFVNAFFYITVSEVFTVGTSTYQTFGIGTLISSFLKQSDLIGIYYSLLFIGVSIIIVTLWFSRLSKWAVARYGMDTRIPIKRHSAWKEYIKRQEIRIDGLEKSLVRGHPILKENKPKNQPGKMDARIVSLMTIVKYSGLFLLFVILAYLIYSIYGIVSSVTIGQWTRFLSLTPFLLYSMGVDYIRVGCITLASFILAISLGYYMAVNDRASKMIVPIFQTMASFPAPTYFPLVYIATLPLLMSIFPFLYVEIYIFILGFLSCFYYVFFNFWTGVRAIPSECWDVIQNYNLGFAKRMRYVIIPATLPYLVTGLSSTINGAWAGLAIGEYWPNIFGGHSLEANVGMMKYLSQNIAQGHVDNAAWISLLFAIVVMIYAIVFTRNLMDLARKKYTIEEAIYQG